MIIFKKNGWGDLVLFEWGHLLIRLILTNLGSYSWKIYIKRDTGQFYKYNTMIDIHIFNLWIQWWYFDKNEKTISVVDLLLHKLSENKFNKK